MSQEDIEDIVLDNFKKGNKEDLPNLIGARKERTSLKYLLEKVERDLGKLGSTFECSDLKSCLISDRVFWSLSENHWMHNLVNGAYACVGTWDSKGDIFGDSGILVRWENLKFNQEVPLDECHGTIYRDGDRLGTVESVMNQGLTLEGLK